MRTLVTLTLSVSLIAPSTSQGNARSEVGCFPSWQIVPTPTDQQQSIWGVGGVSATDFWAVGDATATGEPTLLHWDGSTWTAFSTRVRGSFYGVDVIAQEDAWAVGAQAASTLAMHWDGSTWTRVPTPSPHESAVLNAVASTSSSDVWAVGSRGYLGGLILHWDGTSWSSVPSPSYPGGEEFRGVVASSPTDAWAVGGRRIQNEKPIIIHWDGTSWQDVPLQKVSGGGLLWSVSGSSAVDVWAVGIRGGDGTLAFHWDGVTWARKLLPYRYRAQLRGVSDLAPDDVWVGGLKDSSGPPIALHWNGSTWNDTSTPEENQWFDTIHAFDQNDVLAGGGGAAGIRVEQFVPCP